MGRGYGHSISWGELEKSFGELPAMGRVLELKVVDVNSTVRVVCDAKDRRGVVKRVAFYTDCRGHSFLNQGLSKGAVIRWENPSFHRFLDGSSGARIEDAASV